MPEFANADPGELSRTNARTLQRMEQDLSALNDKLDSLVKDHETRLRALEKYMYIAIGTSAAGLATGIASILGLVS